MSTNHLHGKVVAADARPGGQRRPWSVSIGDITIRAAGDGYIL